MKNHKSIGFLSNTGPDTLKITKLQSQQSMSGHHRHSSETPFKWRFADTVVSLVCRSWPSYNGIFDHPSPNPPPPKKKKPVKVRSPLILLSVSVHAPLTYGIQTSDPYVNAYAFMWRALTNYGQFENIPLPRLVDNTCMFTHASLP